jgi:phosphoglycerol transferase MdoB-like AlkP superfamily enzyme
MGVVNKLNRGMTWAKFFVFVVLLVFVGVKTGDWLSVMVAAFELAAIYLMTQVLLSGKLIWNVVVWLISGLLFFLEFMQLGSYAFAGNYVTYLMLNNLTNLSALGPMLKVYVPLTVLGAVVAFWPVYRLDAFSKKSVRVVAVVGSAFYLTVNVSDFADQSPLNQTVVLAEDYREIKRKEAELQAKDAAEVAEILSEFESDAVEDGFVGASAGYNVIVVFQEGFSMQLLDSVNERGYGLTPHFDAFLDEVISVENYWNHTAATYKGLRGQLTSGYQLKEGYEDGASGVDALLDTRIVSLMDVVGSAGYESVMINAEPKHPEFSAYLGALGFDKVVKPKASLLSDSGDHALLDVANYELLMKTAVKLDDAVKPFLLVDYVFGTHNGSDAPQKYEADPVADKNKIYAADMGFGLFWEDFKASDLYDNTIVVFTTDHATYPTPALGSTFGVNAYMGFTNKIPLGIYVPGAGARVVDANGSNSLDLTPTILDVMGLRSVDNYFLGTSLFGPEVSEFETVTEIGQKFFTTAGSEYEKGADASVVAKIEDYEKVSLNN